MKLFTIEEFANRRRGAQDKFTQRLAPVVTRDLASQDFDATLALAGKLYSESYASDTDAALNATAFNKFIEDMRKALTASTVESDPSVTALMVALAAINAAAIAAADADDEDLLMQWVDMEDDSVRASHKAAHGQTRPAGETFTVGESQMPYPGWTGAPISEWINCRCVLRPVRASDAAMSSALTAALRHIQSEGSIEVSEELFADALERGIAVAVGERDDGAILYDLNPEADELRASLEIEGLRAVLAEHPYPYGLVAAASDDEAAHTSLVVVALPKADHPINAIGDEQKHVTLAYMGDYDGDPQAVHDLVENTLAPAAPFSAAVSGNGQLGPDKASVLFVESPVIAGMRAALESNEVTGVAMAGADAHPHFVPHMTVDYAGMPDEALGLDSIDFDRLAVWHGEDQTEYPLGLATPEQPPLADVAAALDESPDDAAQPDEVAPGAPPAPELDDPGPIPVHGVLAPEGVPSGDGRGFRPNALTNRPLPLPITWQDRTAEGHDDASVVVVVEKIQMIDGLQHWSGHLRDTPEADGALGLLVDFGGRYGLSVDADMAVGEYDEDEEVQWFSEARACGASMVNIPAFPEAYIQIGPHPVLDAQDPTAPLDGADVELPDDAPALVAAGAFFDAVQQFKDLAPGVTEDGPGWLTHPVDTDRLRDYWVRGEGAAKIGWGVPGDFNRCRTNLAQYVKPQYLNGYCANRHYDALHVWPGQEAANESLVASADTEMAPALTLSSSTGGWCAPSAWFDEPEEIQAGPVGVIITPEGRTYGYIATWGECHIGLPGACTAPPTSDAEYAYFKTGLVPTREGGFVEVGQLTIGGGHADPRLGYRGAVAHYDSTSSVWADVNVGENAIGIWFAGSVRPGITEEMIYAARASGRLSGDWREMHGNLELSGALSVNVAGFPIPARAGFAMDGNRQVALIAAGIVPSTVDETSDPRDTGLTPRQFAAEVARILDERETIKTLRSELTEGA